MPDTTADLFDRVASRYDEDIPFFATFGRRLVEWAGIPGGADVLDLGAGKGAVTIALAGMVDPRPAVVAADLSAEMVDRLAALDLPGVRARRLDASRIDAADATFDVVTGGFLVHILDRPDLALAEVRRVLRPGGCFVLSVPGPSADGGWWETYGTIFAAYASKLDDGPPEGMADGPLSWPDAAEAAGLETIGFASTEVALPLGGPEEHWDWLLSHGNRWLYDALSETEREDFRDDVLTSLRDAHPTGGTTLIAGADFHKLG